MINSQPSLTHGNKYKDVPAYLRKYYKPVRRDISSRFIQTVLSWAEIEYHDNLNYYEAIQDYDMVRVIKTKTMFDVLASSKVFRNIAENITQVEWDKLPDAYKEVLTIVNNLRLNKYTRKSGR